MGIVTAAAVPAGAASAAPAASAPLVAGPTSGGAPRGTVVLLHQGGWAGPDAAGQAQLSAFPGRPLRRRGYRTASLDYAAGKAGLRSVLHQLAALRRAEPTTPMCLYGESAGGTLALLAAARDARVRCVMTLGAPTDFSDWRRDAALRVRDPDVDPEVPSDRREVSQAVFRQTVLPAFGAPGPATRRWEPARVAGRIHAAVLLAQQRDDVVVPRGQLSAFTRRMPTARTALLGADPGGPPYLHGTLSPAGRRSLVQRLARLLRTTQAPG